METQKTKTPKKLLGLLGALVILILIVAVFTFSSYSKSVAEKADAKKAADKIIADKKVTAEQTAAAEQKKQAETAAAKKTDNTTKPASGTISDDLYKYEVLINGIAYSLPDSFATFEKNGWLGKDFGNNTLDPNKYNTAYLENGDKKMMISIANFGTDVLPLSKCHVGKISIDSYNKKSGTTISIAKGITIGSTYDELIAAYGKPSEERKSDMLNHVTYKSGNYSNYDITIDNKTKKVSSIDMKNLVIPKKAETASVHTELPAAVKNYKAPTSLGNDLYAFQVKYGGVFYKLPVPITELVKNGWVIQSKADEVIAAKSSSAGVELRKDNQVLRTQIKNYSDKGEPLKNCFATYVEYYNNGAMIPIELPKGITEKSTIEQVIAAYGKPTKVEDSASFKYYTYGEIFKQVNFIVKDGKIEKIEVNYAPKNLN